MIETYIKYFTLLMCSFYVFAKLLNIKKTAQMITLDVIFAVILSYGIYCLRLVYLPLTIPALVVLFLLFVTLTTKVEPGLSITATTISFGIEFTLFAIASLLSAIILKIIGLAKMDDIIFIFIALIQVILTFIPFQFRRLKSGMPFLQRKGGGMAGVVISTALLCCFLIGSNITDPASFYFIVPVILIFTCGICILFWWRRKLQNLYIEKLRAAEIQGLEDAVLEKEEQIKLLKQHNDFLAKIIHKDNKLIPAMELAVRGYLQLLEQEISAENQLKGKLLLEQLETISFERAGVITEYESENEKLPVTGVFQIDTLMTYMHSKAKQNGIKCEFTVSASIKYMVENIISVSDLRTLLADLLENAVIATKNCEKKKIFVSFTVLEGYYLIDIFDSGLPFEREILENFGRKQITTHADTGGSGIGLITVSEILSNYAASFIIEEFPSQSVFTKKISVKFDHLNQFIIKTNSDKEVRTIPVKQDLILNV